MKKTLLAATLTGLFAMSVQAQNSGSSVTLYGLLNAGLTHERAKTEHSGPNWQQSSGMVSGNRWGLRGQENLGGGTQAIFTLGNGFDLNRGTLGQGGRMFGRQAFGGLSNNQLGTLTLGRQYDSLVDHLGPLSLAGTQYGGDMARHPNDNDNLASTIRINNSIKYQSPNYSGLQFSGLYGFSNKAGDFSNNRAYSLGLSYANGPLELAAGFLQVHGAKNASDFNSNGAADNLVNFDEQELSYLGNTYQAKGGIENMRVFGLGGAYTFGSAKIGLLWTQSREVMDADFLNKATDATVSKSASTRLNNIELNGRFMLSPAVSLSGGYTYTFGSTSTSMQGEKQRKPKMHTVTLQLAYAFSKRTDVYLAGMYRKSTGANVETEVERIRHYLTSGNWSAPKRSQSIVTAGFRHRF